MRKIIFSFFVVTVLLSGTTVNAAPQIIERAPEIQPIQPEVRKAFVLVHGAWHGAWSWRFVAPLLRQNDQNKVIAIDLPGSGNDFTPAITVHLGSYGDKVCQVLAQIDPIYEVNLVAHSMGGMAISDAAEKCSGLIDKLIYVAAFLPPDFSNNFLPDGLAPSLIAMDDNSPKQTVKQRAFPELVLNADNEVEPFNPPVHLEQDFVPVTLDLTDEDSQLLFYGGVDEDLVEFALERLRPQPFFPLVEPFIEITKDLRYLPKYYIETTNDYAIHNGLQRMMYEARNVDAVRTLNTAHSPFLSNPQELSRMILELSDL